MLQLKEIKKDYVTSSETVHALRGVSISFRKCEFVSILGPSGCGKTTLLNIIGGLDKYTDGDLIINGTSTKEYRDRDWDVYRNHRIGFIFQSYNLIPHQTILGNVELALTISGVSKEERTAKAKLALDRVGLKDQYYKRPNQLSGGQCQRVAIARALVNDPEILLADEPTGALDTVTSVQIMDLIKEISGERLVIMVTHNPEIAEQYSTRIIRLLDGYVKEDSNPFSAEEEEAESLMAIKEEEEKLEAELVEITDEKKRKKIIKKKKEKAKMSFFTAFKLSAKNLISKKGRTTMVGFAGSIGIIGIALVLAFSAGIKGYIASMQDDMLSGNPIEIAETGFNAGAISEIMKEEGEKIPLDKLKDKVYIDSTVEGLAKMNEALERLFAANTITKEYVEYVKAMPPEYYNAMILNYGIDMSINLFTDFKFKGDSEAEHVSIKRLIDTYTAVLSETEYKQYSAYIPFLVPSMQQAPNNSDYILSQYELLGNSKVATEADELMLVLNSKDEISDLLLAIFGYYTQEEFLAIVDKATAENKDNYASKSVYREYFDYTELLNKEFVWYPTDSVFTSTEGNMLAQMMNGSYQYNSSFDGSAELPEGAQRLKVVGILTPKENVSYGSLGAGIYYTEALANHILATNKTSTYINDYLMSDKAVDEIGTRTMKNPATGEPVVLTYSTIYQFNYRFDDPKTPEDESVVDGKIVNKPFMGIISPSSSSDAMSMIMGGSSETNSLEAKRDSLIRNLGGNDLANNILIFPKSFDEKDLVTNYLDQWDNPDAKITVDGREIPMEERIHITYTDTLELIIAMINTMIDVVSYALIAFTSVSLVVSTVMIGIITYVSVVERIKEIGVIRSLGGRKKDVSHLFNAETFIIGALAGLIGVGATYLISAIVNIILKPLINYSSIAALPLSQALVLIALSIGLTLISGLIPARSAAKKDPVVALRTE